MDILGTSAMPSVILNQEKQSMILLKVFKSLIKSTIAHVLTAEMHFTPAFPAMRSLEIHDVSYPVWFDRPVPPSESSNIGAVLAYALEAIAGKATLEFLGIHRCDDRGLEIIPENLNPLLNRHRDCIVSHFYPLCPIQSINPPTAHRD